MNWIQESINRINNEMSTAEKRKALDLIELLKKAKETANDELFRGSLLTSRVWNHTDAELIAVMEMRESLSNYNPQHAVQKRVLRYLRKENNLNSERHYSRVMEAKARDSSDAVDEYINKSKYWEKKTVDLVSRDKKNVKWVFAINKQMQAVICKYRGWFICTSISSHENIMRELEGRELTFPARSNGYPKVSSEDAILEIIRNVPDAR